MMKYVLLFCLFATAAEAADANGSLFFTPRETRAIDDLAAKAAANTSETDLVHLGAVFYYGPSDWVLWLQKIRWVPATRNPELAVIEVRPDSVRLRITPRSGASPYEIILRPYQTYQLSTGRVLEGVRSVSASPEASSSSDVPPEDAK